MTVLKKFCLIFVFPLVLSACGAPQLIEDDVARSLSVRDVNIDMTSFKGVVGRTNEVTAEQVRGDISQAVQARLRAAQRGQRPVNVVVQVEQVSLVSPGQSLLVGGVSTIRGKLVVRDARTQELVLENTPVVGTAKGTWAPGGLIGAMTTRSVSDDYRATVAGFASDVEARLFGTRAGKPVATRTVQPQKTEPELSRPGVTASSTGDEDTSLASGALASSSNEELRVRSQFDSRCTSFRCEVEAARARSNTEGIRSE